ncbi:MAG: DUF4864 domain-containing protein [Planktomarina sp.]
MKHLVLALGLCLAGMTPATANEVEIQATIQGQIDAFLADDFDQAFTFASPTIQAVFGSRDRFETMVRNGYPMVHRPANVRFLDLRTIDSELWQKVQIRDVEGLYHIMDYKMINMNGDWLINGVQLIPTPQLGA